MKNLISDLEDENIELENQNMYLQDRKLPEYLPEHLQNIRYTSCMESLFEHIERIPIEALEEFVNRYSL